MSLFLVLALRVFSTRLVSVLFYFGLAIDFPAWVFLTLLFSFYVLDTSDDLAKMLHVLCHFKIA